MIKLWLPAPKVQGSKIQKNKLNITKANSQTPKNNFIVCYSVVIKVRVRFVKLQVTLL
jgi:hypothetical protein